MHLDPIRPHESIACLRPVSSAIDRCELTYLCRSPIEYAIAAEQHAAYAALLACLGLEVVLLPPEPHLADATFVEDVALVFDEVAVIASPIASRRQERASVRRFLAPYRRLACIPPAARLEGGDVIRKGRTIYVGQSHRTDRAGFLALRRLLEPCGYDVLPVPVHGCLHLSTGASYLGDETFLVNANWVDTAAFDGCRVLRVAEDEPWAANVLRVGDRLIVPAAFSATRAMLEACGFLVVAIDVSELQKAEAGVTCLSLTFVRQSA